MLLKDFYGSTYAPLRLLAAIDHCRYQYERNINTFGAVLGRPAELKDLTDINVSRLVAWVLKRGRSPATANKVFSQIRALWELAARLGLVCAYPTLRKMPEYRRVPVAWNRQQLGQLFTAIRTTPGRIAGYRASEWWQALHCVLWDTGLRIGAAMKVEWTDLDWWAAEIIVRAEIQKQKADQRFRLHKDTMAALSLIRADSGPLFPWPASRTNLWDHYERILKRAGLPHGRRDKFHRMRRSVASWFEACGGDATSLLGHSTRKVTLAYLDEAIIAKKAACDVLFRPLEKMPP